MRRLALAASLVWGGFLALLLLGAGLDGSTGLIVYAGCALGVWLCGFLIALKRDDGPRLALIAIPLSLLGPLAILPVAIRRWRKARPPRPEKQKAVQPAPVQRAAPPRPQPLPVARQPVPRHRASGQPYQVLAAMLIGSILTFPVVGIVLLTLLVLGGAKFVTAGDIRGISLVSGSAAGLALLASTAVWHEQSRESSRRARYVGWSLIALAAVPVAGATVALTQGTSPKNLSRPTVSGRSEVGSLLTGHAGRWTTPSGRLFYTYQWQHCDPACTDIDGAGGRTYAPAGSDLRKRIRFSVVASPSHGGALDFDSDWAYSRETGPVRR